jgi:hypothetical protein
MKNFIAGTTLSIILLLAATVFGQTDVNVVNSSSAPVPVVNINDAQQPIQKWLGTLQPPNTTVSQLNLLTVPQGKRLVIEFVSVHGVVPQGQRISNCKLTTITGNEIFNMYPVMTQLPDFVFGDAAFGATQTVKLYADQNTVVRVSFNRSGATGTGSVEASISGYLVDMP